MEQAVSLLHQAKTSPAEQRQAVFERIITLIRGVHAAPALLEELLPIVLEMQVETEWRSFIAKFIEGCCSRRPSLIPSAIETLLSLLRDSDVDVVKSVIKCVGLLFHKTLILICSEDTDVGEAELAEMWKDMQNIVKDIHGMIGHVHPGIRNCAIKFIEIGAITLTATEDPDATEGDLPAEAWTLQSIPACHPFLDFSQLKQLGETCLSLLASIAKGECDVPIQTMLVALNALGRVARRRPHLLSGIEPHLGAVLSRQHVALTRANITSIHSTLKSILLGLLKLPSCATYAAVLAEHLHALGADVQAEAARRQMEKQRAVSSRSRAAKRTSHPGIETGQSASKRPRAAQRGPPIPLERLPLTRPLEEWPPQLVAELVMTAMVNYPPALPPHLIDVADTPLHMWPQRLAFPSLGKVANQQPARDEGEVGEGGEGMDGSDGSGATANKIRSKALLVAKPLKPELVKTFAEEAMLRLMDGDESSWGLRSPVVARLFAQNPSGREGVKERLLAYVLEAYHERHTLAIQWLHQLYIEGIRGVRMQDKHHGMDWALGQLLAALAEKGDTRHVVKLLSDCPCVGEECIERVTSLCEDSDKAHRQVGLACLRTLIVHHEAWRQPCLDKLLAYTASEDEALRGPAIRLVCGQLMEQPYLSQTIQKEAITNLRRACQLDAADVQGDGAPKEESESGLVRHRMHLFLSLCAHKHTLLHNLLEAYLQANPAVRSGIQNSISDMVKAIGPESPELINIIQECPEGAEVLVLTFVKTLTEGGVAHPKIVDTIKELYGRKKDARFMIYIVAGLPKDELLDVLPNIVALPSVGAKAALQRILHARPAPLTPEKLVVALHKLQPSKGLPMRKIADSIECCFTERDIFTTQVLAVILQQLVDQNPLPVLYMRTVLLSLKLCPGLSGFVMGILHRLISKQVWLQPTLWEGFIKCCRQSLPASRDILLRLPPNRLADAISHCPDLAAPLQQYIKQQQAQGVQISVQIVTVVMQAAQAKKEKGEAREKDDSRPS